MNLEIRAWDKHRQIMRPCNVYTNALGQVTKVQLRGDAILVSNVEVLISTGINDKHGCRIYEQDIIADSEGDMMIVFWHHESAGFMKRPLNDDTLNRASGMRHMEYWEVVGNRYENPELLER